MRTFYIFKINNTFANLTKDDPYNLFKSMEKIYYADKNNIDLAYNIYDQIITTNNQSKLNNKLFSLYENEYFYTKFNNVHMINDFYSNEQSKLIVHKSFLYLKTTKVNPTFFNTLKEEDNMFVCDFENKDYFWLEGLLV